MAYSTDDFKEVMHQYGHLLDGIRDRLAEIWKLTPATEDEFPDELSYFVGAFNAHASDLGRLITAQVEFWNDATEDAEQAS